MKKKTLKGISLSVVLLLLLSLLTAAVYAAPEEEAAQAETAEAPASEEVAEEAPDPVPIDINDVVPKNWVTTEEAEAAAAEEAAVAEEAKEGFGTKILNFFTGPLNNIAWLYIFLPCAILGGLYLRSATGAFSFQNSAMP